MIIVKLMGGLGNQMFQYAAGRALSLKNNCELKLDLSFLQDKQNKPADFVFRDYDLDMFNLKVDFATTDEVRKLTKRSSDKTLNSVLNKLLGKKNSYFKQPHFHFDQSFFNKQPPLYLDGYWQSEKFFMPFESVIRKDFEINNPIPHESISLSQEISGLNSVCVNVRRGDFVTNAVHDTVGLDYYKKANEVIKSKISNPQYFVFSDDIEWCIENLQFLSPVKFVSHQHAGKKFATYLQLMSLCKYFIIPNSSFAWWAAWLNNDPQKIVIAPTKWFGTGPKDTQDIIPVSWLKL
jgi:hypothetical protein